ncbi:transcriptional regulator with XRE-family HTH domain [Paenibacillus phyllosphaerae]|uniref:Transcriptional regulator with XRE-family HTH domain n=1 Tax=Paenibacillus phyllosphaerae TaxID=274593 RepID=A0A7W5ATN6_9BACL|nr:helix-turn-helix transcriptional regulator [Paenibacillus phyllosphaerae]MBB3108575.1 transcriptional regulator with XRE-family HTH domain [Paenibacillus phyllosphaerae]
MNIGSRIAKLREDRGWTQEQTSASLGISRAALSHYEKNRREPDSETLLKFANLFHVSVDYLVGRTNNPHAILDEPVKEFVDQLELADDELLDKFDLTIDGKRLSAEEARRFIAFVRAERMMNK